MPCRVCGIDKCWAKGTKGNVHELICFKMPTEAPKQTHLNCSTEFAGYEENLRKALGIIIGLHSLLDNVDGAIATTLYDDSLMKKEVIDFIAKCSA